MVLIILILLYTMPNYFWGSADPYPWYRIYIKYEYRHLRPFFRFVQPYIWNFRFVLFLILMQTCINTQLNLTCSIARKYAKNSLPPLICTSSGDLPETLTPRQDKRGVCIASVSHTPSRGNGPRNWHFIRKMKQTHTHTHTLYCTGI